LVFVLVFALAGVFAYLAHRWEKQRMEAWRQAADEMGFDFAASPGEGILSRFPGLHLFSQGRSRKVKNVLRGKAGGLEVSIFDYSYVIGSGKNRQTFNQTVLAFEIDDTHLPTFSLRPEQWFHKVGQWFGYRDIDFESHPRFSKTYLLRGEDEEAVRQVFPDHVLEYYEECPNVCTEGCGGRLVYYRTTRRVDPKEVRTFLEEGFRVLALFRHPQKGGIS
jgi:hypothetical protein